MSILTPRSGPTTTINPDRLFAGITQMVSWDETLISGQKLVRGSLVGRITASGKLTLSLAAAGDGSQVPMGVLVDDYDATGGDVNCGIYIKGEFDQLALTYGTGHTAASVKNGLRALGIYIKPAVSA